MSVSEHYKSLSDRLIASYSEQTLEQPQTKYTRFLSNLSTRDKRFLQNIAGHTNVTYRYQDPNDIDIALETIDLERIYGGVESREKKLKPIVNPDLAYEDYVVLELLDYFKNDFFKWVNKPKCHICSQDGDNIISTGVSAPPSHNPDEVSRIENYRCTTCNVNVDFARLNSPTALLRTRSGRCGEWVNCFMLLLQALLGADQQIRYVWNYEDHVWCEYYSAALERWVHLDPCEGAFDESALYCENWGKSMSWVFGFGLGYMVDLSAKYITKPEKQLNQLEKVSSKKVVSRFLDCSNISLMRRYFYERLDGGNSLLNKRDNLLKLYSDVILRRNREVEILSGNPSPTKTASSDLPVGRQSGSAEWTKSRGEAGGK
ncbi:peptide-N(4)-(N-acetyl-beta-glucosaminyl)asparagine amidase [[Candida] anglica]|uniref:Peptide:N-glycanase 1 n=1 Tax=[Candida] anglica TaxID=148631 RepID=A0ABP0ECL7_9ASCO